MTLPLIDMVGLLPDSQNEAIQTALPLIKFFVSTLEGVNRNLGDCMQGDEKAELASKVETTIELGKLWIEHVGEPTIWCGQDVLNRRRPGSFTTPRKPSRHLPPEIISKKDYDAYSMR